MPAHPLYIFPYNSASASAKSLASTMHVPLLRREHSKYQATPAKRVINWGAQTIHQVPHNILGSFIVNHPANIASLSNKKNFFKAIFSYNTGHPAEEIPIPLVFHSKAEAMAWHATSPDTMMVARTILNGHSGNGIVLISSYFDWGNFHENCNLFTAYIKKATEFRVHFTDFSDILPGASFNPFFNQRKARPVGAPVGSNHIRNVANGYIYVNEDGNVVLPPAVEKAVERFGEFNYNNGNPRLHFGALDIIYNKKYNKAYVLEVNTAPGLSGLTIEKYAAEFKKLEN